MEKGLKDAVVPLLVLGLGEQHINDVITDEAKNFEFDSVRSKIDAGGAQQMVDSLVVESMRVGK